MLTDSQLSRRSSTVGPAAQERILLSVPHMGGTEQKYVQEAFDSNWLSTVGPNITAFEESFGALVGLPAVSLSSGTAAMHLGLRLLGVGPGDEVFCPTLTFVATANPITYLGARPVFVDSDAISWNLDPQLLDEAMADRAARGRLPRAVIVVHLFGQSADLDPILQVCRRHGVPVLEDAAEALGTLYKGRQVGAFGDIGVFSFNGNKIITTTSGGMLVAKEQSAVDRARFWSTQARDPGLAYEHSEAGYNYRMSNVLAGIGRGQLEVLDQRVRRRREIALRYQAALAGTPGLSLMPQCAYGRHTNWLSCILVDPTQFGSSRDELIAALDVAGIESRPVWKPMHMQPLFAGADRYRGEVAASLYQNGICLPSSSSLTDDQQSRVVAAILKQAAA